MDILIIGVAGSGKSKLGDLIRNTIFKLDSESQVLTRDPDRSISPFGSGKNVYSIEVRQANSLGPEAMIRPEDFQKDVIVILTSGTVGRWFQEVYES